MKGGQREVRDRHYYSPPSQRTQRERRVAWERIRRVGLVVVLFALVGGGLWWFFSRVPGAVWRWSPATKNAPLRPAAETSTGKVTRTEAIKTYSPTETAALIRQTNSHYQGNPGSLKEQTFRYTMADPQGGTVEVYGRVFMPANFVSSTLPVFAFAPGTTGIDDACAASLEEPARRNWANYPSLLAEYAASGYIVVTTDYEGMRDSSRLHHYMVGELEGRALLDGVRALQYLPLTQGIADSGQVFLAGYSQGGHATLWADRLAGKYAPELDIRGAIGFGPVTDVRVTLTDTTKGANILWFGPYVLYSYADWYNTPYDLPGVLMPPFSERLGADIAHNCIDTNIKYWGDKDIKKVYTQPFIDAMKTGSLARIAPTLDAQLAANLATTYKTATPKLINQGRLDNVILPAQSEAARKALCDQGNAVSYKLYPQATHYSTMVTSFGDTLAWMKSLRAGLTPISSCP